MGLLNLFLQNQSQLDITQLPTPGNGPVGTPTGEFNTGVTPFQQTWNSNKTYINSFIGGVNTGIQPPTLKETGLDVDNPNYIPSTTTPNTLTVYPATAVGGLGQSAVQFLQIWSPVVNYNNVVVGAPTSPLAQSLPETGLDNTDSSAVPTTVSPINTTSYPNLATGEFGGAPTQYNNPYGPNNTYESTYINDPINFDTLQSTTLDETGLDNTNSQFTPTTLVPIDNTVYPAPPQTNLGEFNGALPTTNFTPQYNPGFGYLDTYSKIITLAGNIQVNTLGQTGLDVENFNAITFTPNSISAPTTYPALASGEFGNVSNQYTQIWNPTNQYINGYNPLTQPSTLGQTGLDNTNSSFAPTTTTPGVFNQYPQFVQGEFNGAPTQFNQIWSFNNKYIINYNPNIQPSTLSFTGLDNTNNAAAPTTTTPNTVTQYPSIATGEFGGVSNQYSQVWSSNNTYDANYNPNTQPNTLGQTGLDTENQNAAPTTTTPNTLTQYPSLTSGEFGGGAGQYTQNYGPNNTYLNSNFQNAQQGTLDLTGLDNIDSNALPTTFIPNNISAPTDYGIPSPSPQIQMGEFGGAPSQYQTLYNPNSTYLSQFNNIVNPITNPQVNTLDETGLDVENPNSAPTTVSPTTITVYPLNVTGELGEAPSQFNQEWVPTNEYYDFMKTNYQAK